MPARSHKTSAQPSQIPDPSALDGQVQRPESESAYAALKPENQSLRQKVSELRKRIGEMKVTIDQSIGDARAVGEILQSEVDHLSVVEQALHHSEARFAGIIESAMDAMVSIDEDYNIIVFHKAAERLFGYRREAVTGRPLDILLPERYRRSHRRHVGAFVETEVTSRSMNSPGTLMALRSSGEEFPIEATISQVDVAGERILTAIVREVTQRVQEEEELRKLKRVAEERSFLLETVNRLATDILTGQTGIEALRQIAEAARKVSGADYAALGVAKHDGSGLSEFITIGLTPEQEARIGGRPRGVGILGLLLRRWEALRIDDLTAHPAAVGFPANHPPMRAFLGVPIRRQDITIGSLYLTKLEGKPPFTAVDQAAVEALGAHAAVGINNMQLLSRERALVQALMKTQEEERLAVAYDLHDGLTQYVMASQAHLESFRRARETGNVEREEKELEIAAGYVKDSVVESRRLVNGLRNLILDDLGLAGALEQMVDEEKSRAGWEDVELVHNIEGRRFDKLIETAAFRVAQEALSNARKHASSSRIRVEVMLGAGEKPTLTLKIRDWGCGFEPAERLLDHSRLGLHSMSARVTLLGGRYELFSTPGVGTTVTAVFCLS